MIEKSVLFLVVVVSVLLMVYIKIKTLIIKTRINDMHMDSDKEVKRYVLPIENTHDDSYIKVEIIQRDIKKGDLMDDTYYRLKYYIGDKLQLSYDLDHYDMATDSVLTSSILNERTLDYNISKNISKNDLIFYKSYMDIVYLSIYKSVEMYESADKIVSKYKKLVKDKFYDV